MKNLIYIIFILFPLTTFSNETSKPLPGRVLGDASANIIIEEYASMSCGHCANFHNKTFKAIKEEFIDTGKAKLIFHDFPLDNRARLASLISQCMKNKEQFFDVLGALFLKQTDWSQADWKSQDEMIDSFYNVLKIVGLDRDSIKSCVDPDSQEVQERWAALETGARYAMDVKGVESTPTFFINGKLVSIRELSEKIREYLE